MGQFIKKIEKIKRCKIVSILQWHSWVVLVHLFTGHYHILLASLCLSKTKGNIKKKKLKFFYFFVNCDRVIIGQNIIEPQPLLYIWKKETMKT
jgi:hypothetical protein